MSAPTRRTASMLIPARVVATLTDEHSRTVVASASGTESRKSLFGARHPFVHERRVTADEIHADDARRVVNRARASTRIVGRAPRVPAIERRGRNRDALVGDAQAELVADLVDGRHEPRRHAFDLLAHARGGRLDRVAPAVAQRQTERHGAHVEVLHLGHPHGLLKFPLVCIP